MSQAAAARSLAHLQTHRRLILMRSLAAGAAGMFPVPLVDDWLAATIRRGTLRRIAEAHRVDLAGDALDHLADAPGGEVPRLGQLLRAAALPLVARRGLRKSMLLLAAWRRADDALRSFGAASLFDHYAARLHVGAGLDRAAAERLRTAIDGALANAKSHVALALFRRALAVAGRAALAVPAAVVARGARALQSRLGATPLEAEVVADATLDAAEAATGGGLGRLAASLERPLATLGATYLDDLVQQFETRWSR